MHERAFLIAIQWLPLPPCIDLQLEIEVLKQISRCQDRGQVGSVNQSLEQSKHSDRNVRH